MVKMWEEQCLQRSTISSRRVGTAATTAAIGPTARVVRGLAVGEFKFGESRSGKEESEDDFDERHSDRSRSGGRGGLMLL